MAKGLHNTTVPSVTMGGTIEQRVDDLARWGRSLPFGAMNAQVRRDGNQVFGPLAMGVVDWEMADTDTDGFWNPAVPSRLTVKDERFGLFVATFNFVLGESTLAADLLTALVQVNGICVGSVIVHAAANGASCVTFPPFRLKPRDYVTFAFNNLHIISYTLAGSGGFPSTATYNQMPVASLYRIAL